MDLEEGTVSVVDTRSRSYYVSSEERGEIIAGGEGARRGPPLVQLMKFMPPSMLVAVTLKYQGKTESLFVENPAPLWCFIASTCVYWVIAGVLMNKNNRTPINSRRCFQILYRAAIASAVLSALSLFSIFVPYPFSIMPLLMWAPLSVIWVLWPLIHPQVYQLVQRGIAGVVTMFQAMLLWAGGGDTAEEETSPPV